MDPQENVRPGGRSGRAACVSRTECPDALRSRMFPMSSSPVVASMPVTDGGGEPASRSWTRYGSPGGSASRSGTIRDSCPMRNAGRSRFLAGPRLRAPVGSQAFRRCVVTHFGHRSKNARTERAHERSGSKSRGGSSTGRPGRPIRLDTRIPGREPGRAMDTRAGPGDGHAGRAGRWTRGPGRRWTRGPGRAMAARRRDRWSRVQRRSRDGCAWATGRIRVAGRRTV